MNSPFKKFIDSRPTPAREARARIEVAPPAPSGTAQSRIGRVLPAASAPVGATDPATEMLLRAVSNAQRSVQQQMASSTVRGASGVDAGASAPATPSGGAFSRFRPNSEDDGGHSAARSGEAAAAGAGAGRGAAARGASRVFSGGVVNIRMHNADWGTCSIVVDDTYEVVKLTGEAVKDLEENQEYEITGVEKNHPKYGLSYEVVSATPSIRLNEAAITKFIADNFKNIGQKTAAKFVARVKAAGGDKGLAELREQLLRAPWEVDFSVINREGTYEMQSEEQEKSMLSFVKRDLATRLTGVPSRVIEELSRWLLVEARRRPAEGQNAVQRAWSLLSEDPYTPSRTIAGYGFALADQIGMEARIPIDAPVRLRALACAAVRHASDGEGNVFVHAPEAIVAIKRFDSRVNAHNALAFAIDAELLASRESATVNRIYPLELLRAEESLARSIAEMVVPGDEPARRLHDAMAAQMARDKKRAKEIPGPTDTEDFIQRVARDLGGSFKDGLDESQVAALSGILWSESRIHTLTAGPGCGKTSVMEVLLKMLQGTTVHLCAPTGKGSKVLAWRAAPLGYDATTIHSLLRGSVESGFAVNAEKPLEGALLVIDEGSMPDLRLMDALLKAVPKSMHVLVLGDPDQLPSIAPGRVLVDLLETADVDHHRLYKTHRNKGAILGLVKDIRGGRVEAIDHADLKFSHGLPAADLAFRAVEAQYLEAVDRVGVRSAILLMSKRKGKVDEPGWNTTFANEQLRRTMNPSGARIQGCAYLVGDRVIIRENMTLQDDDDGPEVRVVNGDTGTIIGSAFENVKNGARQLTHLKIQLDDDREIALPSAAIGSLGLAYALTVHAAQGSEYREVVAVVTKGASTFVNRNMLYTGVSRARDRLQVFADDADLAAIAATPLPRRNSALVERTTAAIEARREQFSDDDEREPSRER